MIKEYVMRPSSRMRLLVKEKEREKEKSIFFKTSTSSLGKFQYSVSHSINSHASICYNSYCGLVCKTKNPYSRLRSTTIHCEKCAIRCNYRPICICIRTSRQHLFRINKSSLRGFDQIGHYGPRTVVRNYFVMPIQRHFSNPLFYFMVKLHFHDLYRIIETNNTLDLEEYGRFIYIRNIDQN